MKTITKRNITRYVHIALGASIATYIYSPWHENVSFQLAIKFLLIPLLTLSGLWLWKGHLLKKVLPFTIIFPLASFTVHQTNSVKVEINGLEQKGELYVGLYTSNNEFGNISNNYKKTKFSINNQKEVVAMFDNVVSGEYAVAIFQDLNGNGKLDKNMFGYPKEPFGFSNNVKPKLSAPTFQDCKFGVSSNKSISIQIIN